MKNILNHMRFTSSGLIFIGASWISWSQNSMGKMFGTLLVVLGTLIVGFNIGCSLEDK